MAGPRAERVQILDSHTGGEPTRVILAGGPQLEGSTMEAVLSDFRGRHDDFRRAVALEPRGSDALVGALLVPPFDPSCETGVIFFNNVGYLAMCGHGTMGLVVSLAHLGRIGVGDVRIETPAGIVTAHLHSDAAVSVRNVVSYRHLEGVSMEVAGLGSIRGDIAYGGNWFFLSEDHGQSLDLSRLDELMDASWRIRQALEAANITGKEGALIDHIELVGPAASAEADAKNFVLCPGGAYDRSPCGTGTSAKLACLAADEKLAPGETWIQEGIVGSRFEASYENSEQGILPTITGRAFVHAEGSLCFDPDDPFAAGIGR